MFVPLATDAGYCSPQFLIVANMSDINMVAYADDMYFIYEADTWENVSPLLQKTR